ncbi:ATP-binding cassette, subfamily F, member 3 [Eubacterium ruminantium]|uniref:ATP-binding cassette, subfamily F, member 3 n=1 Tax=Eubacterium ruminantium TaxID=42322 RepID=A0A1T4NUC5_9FIRM|nr:ABC-F family ATP-binding cassette domain-containing protein [Eubacterium ruminantium]SCW55698.1 ATP-binding cassette, subfamily F, member 3 [Eubacterium ruminantium]SDN03457.1 ATP-binding cassette, subfamily F, member 3 [Eubacterium ruminantium]SJZ82755.1 ATP-binding cassette, subfamily F, member 3 [Eubacterium ruminantium]
MILSIQNITKSYGDNTVLKNINFQMEAGEKIALIGINGAGKTTLLKMIIGEETPDSGNVIFSKDVSFGYLSQHQDISFDNTIYQEMLDTKKDIINTKERIRSIEHEMTDKSGAELDKLLEEYNKLQTIFDRENGYAYESEITGVLKGLGFTEEDYSRNINTLSGGQKMRIALGRLLLERPDILILDEPTNHLDTDSVTWLEGFLSSYSGAVIVVSHDRYFIDRVSNKIVEIDQGVSAVYKGSYSFYATERAKIREAKLKAYLNQQKEIKHQEEVITKLKEFNREKSIKRAESREKMLSKIDRLEKPTEQRADMRLSLTPVTESGEDVLYVSELSKSFGNNHLFSDLTIDIKRGEHVALIGGNGTGKTTILKIINRLTNCDSGHITLGARVHVGYFDQEHHNLSPEKTIFDEISDSFPDLNNTKIRNVLAAFLFTGDDVFKQIKDLSGGERGRVSLAKLMLSPANFLILDEPTNHLDIQSKEILEDALVGYKGTLLFVSHDRYFINKVSTRILELRNKVLTNYKGNYDYYVLHKDEMYNLQHPQTSAAVSTSNAPVQQAAPQSSSKENFLRFKSEQAALKKKENELKKTEERIAVLEEQIEALNEKMNDPEIATNVGKLTEISKEHEKLSEELETLYEKWEELSE